MTDTDNRNWLLQSVIAQRDNFARRLQEAGLLEETYTMAGAIVPPVTEERAAARSAEYVEWLAGNQGAGTALEWAKNRLTEVERQNRGLRQTQQYALRLEELVGEIRALADVDRVI